MGRTSSGIAESSSESPLEVVGETAEEDGFPRLSCCHAACLEGVSNKISLAAIRAGTFRVASTPMLLGRMCVQLGASQLTHPSP